MSGSRMNINNQIKTDRGMPFFPTVNTITIASISMEIVMIKMFQVI